MNRTRGFILGALSVVCAWVLFPQMTHAALVYFDPGTAEMYRGDTLTVAVRLDTDEGECINTADIVVEYDPSIRAVDVSRGDSILNIWVEEPTIDETAHTITFAGGIPGGYCGRIPGDPRLTNILAELVFRLPGLNIGSGSADHAVIRLGDASQILLNDGFGTQASVRTLDAEVVLRERAGSSVSDEWRGVVGEDSIPPADFSITLTRDETAFSGDYFVVFNTVDKQSGIDHYELMEEPFEDFALFEWGGVDAPWTTVTSPYVLEDQTLNSTIRIKAIDKAGNETIAVLVPEIALRSISTGRLYLIAVLVAVALIIAGAFTYAFMQRRKRVLSALQEPNDTI